jgi:molybdopterin-binding protein
VHDGEVGRATERSGRSTILTAQGGAVAVDYDRRMADAPLPAPANLTIGEAAQALGVSVDTLRRWERTGKVAFEREGTRRVIAATRVAELLRERRAGSGSSARNRLDGIVIAVKRDTVMAQVELACGPFRVVSLMSREAADELHLEPGVRAAAVIKATTVVVETAG